MVLALLPLMKFDFAAVEEDEEVEVTLNKMANNAVQNSIADAVGSHLYRKQTMGINEFG